jgi:hypothetical protein
MELFRQFTLINIAISKTSGEDTDREWDIICPEEYNSTNPKPKSGFTPQGHLLASVVDRMEQREIKEAKNRGEDVSSRLYRLENEEHLEIVPFLQTTTFYIFLALKSRLC